MASPAFLLKGAFLLIGGTIVWRVARRDADRKERNEGDRNLEESEHSNSSGDDAVPDIFLSHSGKQKPFVERLSDELKRINYQTVFFAVHSLPKGSPFPPHIRKAARGCKVGVVVLSEDFLTSKWPMIELEILVLERNGHVLPLFFRLNPRDLTNSIKLSKWRRIWKNMVGVDRAKRWEDALNRLGCFNGEVYLLRTSEGAYITKVVDRISTLVLSPVPYDCSFIQGQSRLAQEIASKFERLDARQASMVGLHGVGGLGKTALCKVMVNHYMPQYYGRSFLLEFPTLGSGDMSRVIMQCKKALDKLTDASDKHLLTDVDDFDQVIQLMRSRVGRHDVFLAVDNVWEKFLEEAKRVLRVGFSANSKILVMSRSEEVLKDLLRWPISNVIVDPLPALEHEEAFHVFQDTFELDDLGDLVGKKQVNEMLERCRFGGSYHPLALKAFAIYVKRVCMRENSKEEIKDQISCVLKEFNSEIMQSEVDKVIRLSYDSLLEPKKHIFLDIAVLLLEFRQDHKCFKVQEWVDLLYGLQSHRIQIIKLMNDLSLDGLIQIEERWDGEKAVGLHDLYYELALREIASSPRFCVERITNIKSGEKIEPEELMIVVLEGSTGHFEKLQQCACPKLRLLKAACLKTRRGICMSSMPSLSVLTLHDITLVESTTNSDKDSCSSSGSGSQEIVLHGLIELQRLRVSSIEFVEELAGLDALRNLRRLEVSSCSWLRSLDGLRGLVQLQALHVNDCGSLRSLPDMRHLTCLESLQLSCMGSMEEVGGLPSTLQEVFVRLCEAMKRMPDVSSLTRLKSLVLTSNGAMEEVEGDYFCSSLARLSILNCRRLRSHPHLDECKHLKWLETQCAHLTCSSLQSMPNLPTGIRDLYMGDEPSLIKKIDVGCLTNLGGLYLKDCGALEEVAGLTAHRSLVRISIKRCRSLVDLSIKQCPRLKILEVGCPSLKKILVEDCKALEEIKWVSEAFPSLQELRVQGPNCLLQGHVSSAIYPLLRM